MWDRLSTWSWWSKRAVKSQPLQRDISITMTNDGDRGGPVTIQRSPSGTRMVASSAKPRLDDDESSEGSTSFGLRNVTSPRGNKSFSYSREPLDPATWSNVTSPGFTSRLVQQASGNSPLKEFNDSLSHSPFRKSPYKNLTLGELPYVNFSRKPRLSPPGFSSLSLTNSFRSGGSSTIYNRDRRRNARQGQVFVRITPIDPSVKTNVSFTRKSTTPTSSPGPFPPPRGSPRNANEPYRNEGLGGIPQQELSMRFNRLWPHHPPPGSTISPVRPSSPTSPSNIMEALTARRKRTREHETFYPPNATPPSMSPPSKISVGIGDTPVRPHNMSKRVKFLGGAEGHDRPMMTAYAGIGAGDSEPLSSESILEQMNQTEKRFLPDSTSTPYSLQKKTRLAGPEDQSPKSMRKRRSQSNLISAVEDEPKGEKMGRFCTCNDCYAEAAGVLIHSPFTSPTKSMTSNASGEKSANTSNGQSKQMCDKGVSTDEDKGAFFRELFRKADADGIKFKKKGVDYYEDKELMKIGKIVYTKEMYDKDKKKRIERYFRLLRMKPPGGTIFDIPQTQEDKEGEAPSTSAGPSSSTTTTDGASGGFSFGGASLPINATTAPATSVTTNFGSVSESTSVPPITTTAPSISLTTNFGSGSVTGSSILSTNTTAAPATSVTTNSATDSTTTSTMTFGQNLGNITSAPSSTPITSDKTNMFGSATSPPAPTLGGTFGPNASNPPPPSTSSGGFSFSGGSSATLPAAPAPSFGQFGGANTQTTVSSTAPTFGASSSTTSTSPPPLFGAGETKATGSGMPALFDKSASTTFGTGGGGFNFGAAASATPAAGGLPTFSMGSASTSAGVSLSTTTTTTTDGGSGGFSFGGGSTTLPAVPATAVTTNFGSLAGSATLPTNTTTALPGFPATSVTTNSVTGSTSTTSTTSITFGQNLGNITSAPGSTTAPSVKPNIFGSATSPAGTAPGGAFGQNPSNPPSSFGGFSFSGGNKPTLPATQAPTFGQFGSGSTQPTVSSSGSTFGSVSSTTSPPPLFGGSGTNAAASEAPTIFGKSGSSTFGAGSGGFNFSAAAAAPSPAGAGGFPNFSTGSASTTSAGGLSSSTTTGGGSGGFSFGGSASLPINTTTAPAPSVTTNFGSLAGSTNTTSASMTFGKTLGINTSAPTSTATPSVKPNIFGSAASPPGTTSGGAFGQNASSPPSSFGGFSFSGGSNLTLPGAQPPAPTFGQFGGGSTQPAASAPAFGSLSSATSPPVFGGGANAAGGGGPPIFGQSGNTTFGTGSGGFNFAAAAAAAPPAPSPGGVGGSPMFNMGSASTAPRRRDIRRRHR